MPEEQSKKKRGPKPTFEKTKGYHRGAPRLATRVAPDVLEWVESRPEGTRPYIEQLVRDDRDRALQRQGNLPSATENDVGLTAQQEQAAEA